MGLTSFNVLFSLAFLAVFGIAFYVIFHAIAQNRKNNHSPVITVFATVVTKRGHTSNHISGQNGFGGSSYTTYYATFEFESGDRLELNVPSNQFGYLVEGDGGKLTFQGTRFLKFERM